MNRTAVAKELVRLAKELTGGLFDTAKLVYDNVTPEQLAGIQRAARRFRGKVTKKGTGFGQIAVQISFRDNFPETFATRDAEAFAEAVKPLDLERFTGMPELIGF